MAGQAQRSSPKILIVRRDNIGDLVCTTPLISALRQKLPDAWIGVLANSYNAPILFGNPDIDEIFVYTKLKHRAPDQSRLEVLGRRVSMLLRLRAMGLDDVILATPGRQPRLISMARWLKPRRLIGFGNFDTRGCDVSLPLDATEGRHEAERVFQVARLFGIEGPPPACCVISAGAPRREENRVAVHISARKPSQRWPAERFAQLIESLHRASPQLRFSLFWAPGPTDDPLHPGDDAKALAVLDALGKDFPVQPKPTSTLSELVAGLAECSYMICADGGAMHVAAGLGLPTISLFGQSDTVRWHPWGVPYRLLQKPTLQVADIDAIEVTEAFMQLTRKQNLSNLRRS